MMSSEASYFCDDFKQLQLPLSTVDFHFGQSSLPFLYCQNKLESIRTIREQFKIIPPAYGGSHFSKSDIMLILKIFGAK